MKKNPQKSLYLITFLCAVMMSAHVLHAAASASELLKEHTISVLTSAKLSGEKVAEFSNQLLASEVWQHELFDSGPVDRPEKSIQLLFELWKTDPLLVTRPVDRSMATACALEGPRRKWGIAEMLPRYQFFQSKWKYGLLNNMYQDLSVYERRYLARGVQHGGFNTIVSMEYHNQEVCLPAELYTGACWYARWILHNPFGDSIHGRHYYAPFQESWDNYAEIVRNVGGVCGSLSNFGAAAAIANGIPAVTMGEPGHCAYAVMTKPKHWQPAYSLSWKRGTHTSFHGSSWGWHMMNAKALKYFDDAKASGDLRRLANHYLTKKNSAKAIETIRTACTHYPLDWENWSQSVHILNTTKASARHWQTLHQDTLKHLAPVTGEIAYHLLRSHVYPKVLPAGDDKIAQRKAILLAYQRAVSDWGLARWDYHGAVQHQLKQLTKDAATQDAFMASTFAIHAEKNVFTPDILAAQLKRVGTDEKRLQSFIATIGRSLTKSTQEKGESFNGVINSLARSVLPDAAKRGDKATFQYIGKLTGKTYATSDIKPEKFPGILLSSGGTFGIQKPGNRWDNPSRHWGVIEEHGGDFHTATKPATATVQLGNYGHISGVVIVTRNGHFARLVNAKLQSSIDGKEWTDIHTFKKQGRIHRIDLTKQKINAGHVRVIHEGQPSLHFHKFLVYGKKKN